MAVMDASDFVEVAMRIEENGAAFYCSAAGNAQEKETRDLFVRLAEEEGRHRQTFAGMRAALSPVPPPEGYGDEYNAYLRSYVDHILVFNEEALKRELAKVNDTASAFDFAIQREFESILYYHEVRRMLPESDGPIIDEIIAEERRHFTLLSERKKALAG